MSYLVLHGTWVPAPAVGLVAGFAVWAERPPASARSRSGPGGRPQQAPGRVPRHPFAVGFSDLQRALPASGDAAGWGRPLDALAWLPSAASVPLPSVPVYGAGGGPPPGGDLRLQIWRLPALMVQPAAALRLLLDGALWTDDARLAPGDDLRFWAVAARLALELLHRQKLLPVLEQRGETIRARWRPLLDEERDRRRFETLAALMPAACRTCSWEPAAGSRAGSPQGAGETTAAPQVHALGPQRLLHDFLSAATDGMVRTTKGLRRRDVWSSRGQSLGERWRRALQSPSGTIEVADLPAAAVDAFRDQHAAWLNGASPAGAAQTGAGDTFRVCFRLEPPDDSGDSEPAARKAAQHGAGGAGSWQLRYLLQASDDPSLLVPAADVWRQRGATARFLNRRLDQPQERLLAGLGRAARLFPPLEASLDRPAPAGCDLAAPDAFRFLKEAALVLRAQGFGVLVPGLDARLRLRVRLNSPAADPARGTAPAAFGWDSLVAYDWQVALGDETLSRQEFEQLARLKEPLVQVRGRWVELDPRQMEQALAFFERRDAGGDLPVPDALRLALAPDIEQERTGLAIERVEASGWVEDLLRQLGSGTGSRRPAAEPPGFEGKLRAYQQTGVSWLASLRRYGIGACLADDMGLGKTVQLIALILHGRHGAPEPPRAARRTSGPRARRIAEGGPAQGRAPLLLVCPTSVVGNWQRELARFAPYLRVLVHHGAAREREGFGAAAGTHDVVVSTYALLHRDAATFQDVEWDAVVLDEAQNIKNAATQAAKVARGLRARWRAALTGTPVENRLSELWSIFQFLNPGLLGSAEEFRRRFGNPIERTNDAGASARLRALVSPFILRRVKTDRTVIQDLPNKLEAKVYCSLTREQATLYEAVVRDSLRQIEESDGIQRRGLVLATLTKLKQVCDHPALFLHEGRGAGRSAARSGKLARLREMLEEALAVDDRALVFTQYAEMGRMLKQELEAAFGQEVLFLHGGTPAVLRDRMVAAFQQARAGHGPRVFILSLKAGGTGLNLTAASHVFHFDRWWNPAVENQATDRAFRIGQTRNVQVHKYICAGTMEEKIDELIERKVALSQAIVGTGETWLTEMSTSELRDLLTLRRDAAALPAA